MSTEPDVQPAKRPSKGLTSKRSVLIVGALAVILLVVANGRTWVSGTVTDAVLRHAHTTASGSKAAPALLATALVGAAAVLATLTTGRMPRWIAAVLTLLAGVVSVIAALAAVRNPARTIGDIATSMTGHTGDRTVDTSLTIWPWVAVFGGILLALTGVLAIAGVRSWSGLSSRYDAPGSKPVRTRSDWDLLSDGEDPTDRPDGSDTIDERRPPESPAGQDKS
ncbi:Trp biosynthesis-associated membrane protein [Flexivirga caeni]|uniref:Trp biosynthesis-associated membrane protein n=1 Tax=Flexivirga caeni TaxID=2294115 RepID=UPI001315693F|nr:Trp biosynthesis-associated membrane protein [Flexivirga caeni]